MEANIIRTFLPDLVTAISDCVQPVSDKCLAEGIITASTYSKVLESGGTSEDKTRSLVLAVIKSTETDSRCFGILLNILEQVLPYGVRDALLSKMKKERAEQAAKVSTCMSMVVVGETQVAPITPTRGEIVKQQTSLFGRLEDAIRQHERACAEKKLLEDSVKTKEEENKKLKNELRCIKQSQTTMNESIIMITESRVSGCEAEIDELRGRVEELESIIEEQGMQVKRGRNAMGLGLVN